MKEFNWEDFKDENNKIAVHCKTEEEAKDFCNQMHEHGMKWNTGRTYLECTNYNVFKTKTCYSGYGTYSSYVFYEKREGHTILEWSDYMKEFTKADLKDGMVIECRDKDRFLVFGHKLLNSNGFDFINDIADDLTDKKYKDKDFDIMKVYKVNIENVKRLSDILKHENLELIWERIEVKRMTVDEMQQKLEELTGEKIEIEPSVEEMIGSIRIYCHNKHCNSCIIHSECSGCDIVCMTNEQLKECYRKVLKCAE